MNNTNLAEKHEDTVYGTAEELGITKFEYTPLNSTLKEIPQKACNDNFSPFHPTDPSNQQQLSNLLKQKEEFDKKLEVCKKLAHAKGLSKEAQEKRFQSTFKVAERYLKCELEIANIFKVLPVNPGHRSELESSERIQTKSQFIEKEYGLPYTTAWRISKLTPECVKKAIQYAKQYKELPTRRLALMLLKQNDLKKLHSDFLIQKAKKKQEQKLKREQAKLAKIQQGIDDFNSLQNPLPNLNPNDLYNVIYADPSTINKTLEELKKYIIPSSENSVLFIWSPVKNLPATLDLMNTWGFNYKEHAVWDRMDYSNIGEYFHNKHELLLVGVKGNGIVPRSRETSICRFPLQENETKPEYYTELLKTMFPAEISLNISDCLKEKDV